MNTHQHAQTRHISTHTSHVGKQITHHPHTKARVSASAQNSSEPLSVCVALCVLCWHLGKGRRGHLHPSLVRRVDLEVVPVGAVKPEQTTTRKPCVVSYHTNHIITTSLMANHHTNIAMSGYAESPTTQRTGMIQPSPQHHQRINTAFLQTHHSRQTPHTCVKHITSVGLETLWDV